MKEKIQFEDQKIDSLVNILRSIALGKSDLDDGEIIKRTVTSLNNYADLIIADTDKLPISDEQVSILKNTIKEVVPIIRRSYLTIKERCNKADKNKALATEFAMNFWECHNYRACVNLLGIFNDYQVYKYADTKYLKISGIGVRGALTMEPSKISNAGKKLISDGVFSISLKPHDNHLYLATEWEVVTRDIPFFKKSVTFNRIDKITSNVISKMTLGDYKEAMKWLLCACAKALIVVKDTREPLFIEPNPVNFRKYIVISEAR